MGVTATASRMVGRSGDLDVLTEALAAGARGEPRAVLVRGEAGIGKTRLVREAIGTLDRSPRSGPPPVVAISQCVDLGAIGAPFTPVRRLLRDLHGAVGDEAFREAAGNAATLATIAALVPELAGGSAASAPSGAGAHVPEAVERVLEALSEAHHLVLVLEDLHWADAATLSLLRSLAATMRGTSLTLLMTYRTDDVTRDHPLRGMLAELGRSRVVHDVQIARLSRDELADQAQQILDRPPVAREVDTLMARSDGVPFFVEELLGIPEDSLPESLADVTTARVERLAPTAQAVVRLAAVGGQQVSYAEVAEVWEGPRGDLDDGLRAAVDAHVLEPRSDGLAFRHALIRETVYAQLMPHERIGHHRAFARTLQERADRGEAAAAGPAAEHWLAAGDVEACFDSTLAAMHHARATLAIEGAARLGERLIDLWPRVNDAERRVGSSLHRLRLQVAEDYHDVHEVREALRVLDGALDPGPEDALERAETLLAAVRVGTETERRSEIGDRLAEVRALLDGRDDVAADRLRVVEMSLRGPFARDVPDRWGVVSAAVDLASALGDEDLLVDAVFSRARLGSWAFSAPSAEADLKHVLNHWTELNASRFKALNILVCDLLMTGRFDESAEIGLAAAREAADAGRARLGAHVLSNTAEALMSAGRLDEGLEAARRAAALVRGDSIQVVLNAVQIEAMGLVWSADLDGFDALMARESHVFTDATLDLQWTGVWNQLLADAAVARASSAPPAEAAALLQRACALLAPLDTPEADDEPGEVDVLIISGACLLGAARRAGAEVDGRLAATVRRLAARIPETPWYSPGKLIVEAELGARPGTEEAVAAWRAAADATEAGLVPRRIVHLARARLGEALLASGHRSDGIAMLRRVAKEATGDGIGLVAGWARDALARRGATGADTATAPLGLSPRELEVLALVAQGLSNAQIGERLFISRKTASVHVSAILAKTGAANRTEAATLYAALRRDDAPPG